MSGAGTCLTWKATEAGINMRRCDARKPGRVRVIRMDLTVFPVGRNTCRGGMDVVDCLSFAIMERPGIKKAFTFDRDFAVYGFTIVPGG